MRMNVRQIMEVVRDQLSVLMKSEATDVNVVQDIISTMMAEHVSVSL